MGVLELFLHSMKKRHEEVIQLVDIDEAGIVRDILYFTMCALQGHSI